MPTPPPNPFDPKALSAEVTRVLNEAAIPEAHGFAAIVNQQGASVALATRLADGWQVDADASYDWSQGWQGQLSVAKSWP